MHEYVFELVVFIIVLFVAIRFYLFEKKLNEELLKKYAQKDVESMRYKQICVSGHQLAKRLFAIKDILPFGIARVAPDGTVIECNYLFNKISKQTNAVGKKFYEFTHTDDINIDQDLVHRMLREEIVSYTMQKRYKGDSLYNYEVAFVKLYVLLLHPVFDYEKSFVSVIEQMNDNEKRRFLDERKTDRKD